MNTNARKAHDEICSVCDYWKGLHQYKTQRCPVNGQEDGRYRDTKYQAYPVVVMDEIANMLVTDTGRHWIVDFEEDTGNFFYEEGNEIRCLTIDDYKKVITENSVIEEGYLDLDVEPIVKARLDNLFRDVAVPSSIP